MGQSSGRFRAGVWAAGIGLCAAAPGLAQEAGGDQVFRFGLSQTLRASDNLRLSPASAGTTVYSDTALSFGFASKTALQTFDISAGAVLRAADDPVAGSSAKFRDPTVDLSYARANGGSRFTLQASYARPDLAFFTPLKQTELTNQDLTQSGGTREDIGAGLRLETGLQAPLGFVLGARAKTRSYSAAADPSLFDTRTYTAEAGVRARLSPLAQGRFDISLTRYEADDAAATRTDTRRITAGISYDLTPVTTLDATLGHTDVSSSVAGNAASGAVASAALTRAMPNGQISASVDASVTQGGRQTTLEFGRVLDLPRGGLQVSLGATRGAGFGTRPIGRIDYRAELPQGRITAGLSRAVSFSNTQNAITRTTRANLSYRIDVSALSALDFGVAFADISPTGGATTGRAQGSVSASYSRSVATDWTLKFGYTHRYYNPDTAGPAHANEAFLTLERTFEVFR